MAWSYEINPAKSLNGASSRLLNGPLQKIETFRGAKIFLAALVPFWGQTNREKSRFSASDH